VETWLIENGDICQRCPQGPRCLTRRAVCIWLPAVETVHDGVRESTCFSIPRKEFRWVWALSAGSRRPDNWRSCGIWKTLTVNFPPGSWPMDGVRQCVGTAISFRGEFGVYAFCPRQRHEGQLVWQQIFSITSALHRQCAGVRGNPTPEGALEIRNAYLEEEVVQASLWRAGRQSVPCTTS